MGCFVQVRAPRRLAISVESQLLMTTTFHAVKSLLSDDSQYIVTLSTIHKCCSAKPASFLSENIQHVAAFWRWKTQYCETFLWNRTFSCKKLDVECSVFMIIGGGCHYPARPSWIWFERFEESWSVKNRNRGKSGLRTRVDAGKVDAIAAAVQDAEGNTSVKRVSGQLRLSRSITYRIMSNLLHLYPYKNHILKAQSNENVI